MSDAIGITDRLDHTWSMNQIDALLGALDEERDAMSALRRKVGVEPDEACWPAYAWPGGYPIAYLTDDGESLCEPCMNDPVNPIHFAGADDGWKVIDAYLANETDSETPVTCAHCNATIYDPEE